MTAEQKALAEAHVTLARKLTARAKARCSRLADDIDGAALLGLCEAARTYDPDSGAAFTTYAGSRILGAVFDLQRASYPRGYHRKDRRDDAPEVHGWYADAEEEGRVPNRTAVPDPAVLVADADECRYRLNRLDRRDTQIVRDVCMHGATIRETARSLGLHQSTTRNRLLDAIALMAS